MDKLALTMLGLLALALAGGAWPALAGAPSALVITYSIPVSFEVNATGTVNAAVNGTAGTADLAVTLPYIPSSNASIYLYYKLVNASDGKVLDSANDVSIKLLAGNTTISTVLLSTSPGEATVPLAASINAQNLTIHIENSNTVALNATVGIIVFDTAEFDVEVQPTNVTLKPGSQATVKITVTQKSGPAGTLTLLANTGNAPVSATISPESIATKPGDTHYAYLYLAGKSGAKNGNYQVKVTGKFTSQVPGLANKEYTFAEVLLPVIMEYGAPAAGGFALGAIAGYKLGFWGVAIAVIIIILIIAIAVRAVA